MAAQITLTTLPSELIEGILYHLIGPDSSHLRSICQTSKLLNSIAQPLLSRNVTYSAEDGDEINLQAGQIARHFLLHPERRSDIRQMRITGFMYTAKAYPTNSRSPISLTGPETQSLADCVTTAFPGAHFLTEWQYELERGSADAFFALLITWATRLESLTWCPSNSDSLIVQLVQQVTNDLPRSAAPAQMPLCNIRTLDLDLYVSGIDSLIAPLLHLPQLHTFFLNDVSTGPLESFDFPRRSSALETLLLHNFDATNEGLEQLIMAGRALRKLYLLGEMFTRPHWSLPEVIESIVAQHESLEELIFFPYTMALGTGNRPSVTGLGRTLTKCDHLRRLEITEQMLSSDHEVLDAADCLPSSLEYLVIEFARSIKIEVLLLQCGEGKKFPYLTQIDVCFDIDWALENKVYRVGPSDKAATEKLAQNAGVHLNIKNQPPLWRGLANFNAAADLCWSDGL